MFNKTKHQEKTNDNTTTKKCNRKKATKARLSDFVDKGINITSPYTVENTTPNSSIQFNAYSMCKKLPIQLRTIGFEFQTMNTELYHVGKESKYLKINGMTKIYDDKSKYFNVEKDGSDIEIVTKPVEIDHEDDVGGVLPKSELGNLVANVGKYFSSLESGKQELEVKIDGGDESPRKRWVGPFINSSNKVIDDQGDIAYIIQDGSKDIDINTQLTGGIRLSEFPWLLGVFTKDPNAWSEFRFPLESRKDVGGAKYLDETEAGGTRDELKGLAKDSKQKVASPEYSFEGFGELTVDQKTELTGMVVYLAHILVTVKRASKLSKDNNYLLFSKDWAAIFPRTNVGYLLNRVLKNEATEEQKKYIAELAVAMVGEFKLDTEIFNEDHRDTVWGLIKTILDVDNKFFFSHAGTSDLKMKGLDDEDAIENPRSKKIGDRPTVIDSDDESNVMGFWFEFRRPEFTSPNNIENQMKRLIKDYQISVNRSQKEIVEFPELNARRRDIEEELPNLLVDLDESRIQFDQIEQEIDIVFKGFFDKKKTLQSVPLLKAAIKSAQSIFDTIVALKNSEWNRKRAGIRKTIDQKISENKNNNNIKKLYETLYPIVGLTKAPSYLAIMESEITEKMTRVEQLNLELHRIIERKNNIES